MTRCSQQLLFVNTTGAEKTKQRPTGAVCKLALIRKLFGEDLGLQLHLQTLHAHLTGEAFSSPEATWHNECGTEVRPTFGLKKNGTVRGRKHILIIFIFCAHIHFTFMTPASGLIL